MAAVQKELDKKHRNEGLNMGNRKTEKNCIKRRYRSLRQDNGGSAIVVVIIAMALIGVLVGLYELYDKNCRREEQKQLLLRGDRHGADYGGHAA